MRTMVAEKTWRSFLVLWLGVALGVPAGVRAADTAPAAAPPSGRDVDFAAFDAKSPPQRLVMTLDKAWEGGQTVTFLVWFRGGVAGMAWAETPAVPGYCYVAQANFGGFYAVPDRPLVLKENQLAGSVFFNPPNNQRRAGAKGEEGGRSYVIAATLRGATIAGTWNGPTGKGDLTGKVLSEADLRLPANALDPKANYPCWRNTGNGVGYDTGQKLISDLSQARVVWKGEDLIPPPYHEGINFGGTPVGIQSGHASLVLADGRLFIHYFTGSKTDDPKKVDFVGIDEWLSGLKDRNKPLAQLISRPLMMKRYNRATADQIVLCLDAQTGQTLWKTAFLEDGPNITAAGNAKVSRHKMTGPSNKSASHLTPCVGDGKVFAKGTGGNLYCLEAKTGATLWKQPPAGSSSLCDAVVAADGVVATVREGGLTGYAADDGKKLWTVAKMGEGRGPCTLRWVHEGKSYFITPAGQLVEPRTGKVLWAVEPPISAPAATAVIVAGEGYLVGGSKDGFVAYRITPEKAEKAWSTDKFLAWRTIHAVIYRGHLWVRAVTPENAQRSGARTYCVELAGGKMVADARGTKSFSSVGAGDGFLFNSNAAVVMMQKADPKDFKEIVAGKGAPQQCVADAQMPVILQNTPETSAIYADGRLFTRTFDGIICYDLRERTGP
jgi:outer membrane protein assembly factor BamB